MLGIIHLLAISGLHVQTLLACLFWCLLRAGVTRETARILLLCFLPIYACLTGAAPSVLRACLMAGIYLVMTSLPKEMKQPSAVILSATFLLLLAIHPLYLFDIGFQLSFAVTFLFCYRLGFYQKQKFSHAIIPDFLYCTDCFTSCSFISFSPILFTERTFEHGICSFIYDGRYAAILTLFILTTIYLPLGQTLFQLLDSVIQLSHQLSAYMAVLMNST